MGEERGDDRGRVVRAIERNPGILWRKLQRTTHLTSGALGVIVEELEHETRINRPAVSSRT